jgi:hypothetical protein
MTDEERERVDNLLLPIVERMARERHQRMHGVQGRVTGWDDLEPEVRSLYRRNTWADLCAELSRVA